MSIYWERCGFCGQYQPTMPCTLYSESRVCIYCCISCLVRFKCPVPAWMSELKREKVEAVEAEKKEPDRVKEVLEELLRKL